MKKLPGRRPLGVGSYGPADMAGVQAEGRYRFLESVRQRVPAVLDDLAELQGKHIDDLHEWGQRWQLSEPWCLTTALMTLQAWRSQRLT